MALTGLEARALSDQIGAILNDAAFDLLATDLEVSLNEFPPGQTVKIRASRLVSLLNNALPPRDRELLEKLAQHPNLTLKALALRLLRPKYVSPTDQPRDAVLLGKAAFIDRDPLRQALDDFVSPNVGTTHVLVVRGEKPCGKSYTFEYLRHLAFYGVNGTALRVQAKKMGSPRDLIANALLALRLDTSTLNTLPDDPQLAKMDTLVATFKGQIQTLTRPVWLVIDDLNDASVAQPVREAAFAMAQAVEELRPLLWLVLLGFNDAIVDPDLRHVAQEDPAYPTSELVTAYVETLAAAGKVTLAEGRSKEIATLLFAKYNPLDKTAMMNLTTSLEKTAEKLLQGIQPT